MKIVCEIKFCRYELYNINIDDPFVKLFGVFLSSHCLSSHLLKLKFKVRKYFELPVTLTGFCFYVKFTSAPLPPLTLVFSKCRMKRFISENCLNLFTLEIHIYK